MGWKENKIGLNLSYTSVHVFFPLTDYLWFKEKFEFIEHISSMPLGLIFTEIILVNCQFYKKIVTVVIYPSKFQGELNHLSDKHGTIFKDSFFIKSLTEAQSNFKLT